MSRDVWLPLVTLLLGSGLTLFSTLFTEWFREGRAAERRREQRKADFQRETLLSLQDAMQRQREAASQWVNEQVGKSRQAEEEDRQHTWPLLDPKARLAGPEYSSAVAEVVMLSVRVIDETLRGLLDSFRRSADASLLATNSGDALLRLADATNGFRECNERLGELLRDYY